MNEISIANDTVRLEESTDLKTRLRMAKRAKYHEKGNVYANSIPSHLWPILTVLLTIPVYVAELWIKLNLKLLAEKNVRKKKQEQMSDKGTLVGKKKKEKKAKK